MGYSRTEGSSLQSESSPSSVHQGTERNMRVYKNPLKPLRQTDRQTDLCTLAFGFHWALECPPGRCFSLQAPGVFQCFHKPMSMSCELLASRSKPSVALPVFCASCGSLIRCSRLSQERDNTNVDQINMWTGNSPSKKARVRSPEKVVGGSHLSPQSAVVFDKLQ